MEYQKMINLLDNAPNQTSKFRTKNWVEKNYDSRRTYSEGNQIKFKTSVLKSRLCEWNYTVVELAAGEGNNNIQVVFINCTSFTNCTSATNNAQIDDAKDIDVVIPMYNLIEYSDNHSQTSRSLW